MIPRTLKIRGHVYKIEQVPLKTLDKEGADTDISALIDNNRNVLWLYKRAAASRKVELVIHEVLHAMVDGCGFKDEEAIISILGEGLTEFIKANPGFIRHALTILSR